MGMNSFNRSHPYVQQMEETMSEVRQGILLNTSTMIKDSIIVAILSIIATVLSHSLLPLLVAFIAILSFLYLHIGLVKEKALGKASYYVNGPDYTTVNINEVNILDVVKDLYKQQGKLDQFRETLRFIRLILTIAYIGVILSEIIQLCIPYIY